MWLAPDRTPATGVATTSGLLANAAKLVARGDYAKAHAIVAQPALQQGPLGLYAAYYAGVAQLRLNRAGDALKTFRRVREQDPVGYLAEASALGEAEAHLALDNPAAAVPIYEQLAKGRPANVEDVLLRLGRAATAAGDPSKAADAFARVYYEFALSDLAPEAGSELALLKPRPIEPGSQHYQLELGRAERLFGAKQYGPARSAFEGLISLSQGDDRALVQLRLAESDYFLKRYRAARDRLKPLVSGPTLRGGEALFYFAVASRGVGDVSTYLALIPRIVAEFPNDRWAEEAMNSLALHYVAGDDDDRTARAFRDLYEAFPRGVYAERAAWKAGWHAYRTQQDAVTIRLFERAAVDFPRSDYRPTWLYWAARARERTGDTAAATDRLAIVVADYANSYYGRLAAARLGGSGAASAHAARVSHATGPRDVALPAPPPPNAAIVRSLLAAEMYDDAANELRFARTSWGDSPALRATEAWTQQQQSRFETGTKQFQLARGAISTMRRAYPQFLAAGGDSLPRDVLSVIYPLRYWDLIRQHASRYGLDPYLMAALVAQESTFVPAIRSHANAYGLMQLLPGTAREYAKKLKMPYSSRLLTDPESNVRLGTAFFAERLKEFGETHLALASYNAGPGAVRRWRSERPGLDREEFIDDIPYPETQGYVRRILGTAEDYRRLYTTGQASIEPTPPAVAAPVSVAPARATVRGAASKAAPAKAVPAKSASRRRAAPKRKTS